MRWPGLCKSLLPGLLALFFLAAPASSNWPHWRGPDALGVSAEEDLPRRWDPEAEGSWKIPLPGMATSTPIVWGDTVFLTSQVGRAPLQTRDPLNSVEAGDERLVFVVQAIHRQDGRELWRVELPSAGEHQPVHLKHNLATPSPVTDGERLIVWFGTGLVLCLDLEGRELWRRDLATDYGPFEILWAHGSSPVLHRSSVILLCDHTPAGYLLALDKTTGRTLWRTERGAEKRSYSTPFVMPHGSGEAVVVSSDQRIDIYSAENGELLSFAGQPARVPVSSPVWADGVLYTSRGYRSGPYMALQLPEGRGPQEAELLWRVATGAPYVSSLLFYRGLIYMATESGVVSAVDPADGTTVWKERLGGNFSASPVGADGNVYLLNEEGELFVIAAGRSFQLVEKSELGERTLASPAISGGKIFVRSDAHLFALGGTSGP